MGVGSRWARLVSTLTRKRSLSVPAAGEKALVLSGGGTKGIFQVGALEYLVSERKEWFRIVCGVSVGALNAMMVAQGADYFERLKALWIRQAETGLEIIQDRFTLAAKVLGAVLPGGILYHRLGEIDGIQDNTKLRETIDENARELQENLSKTGTHLRIGVVSLQTGKYYALDPGDKTLAPYTTEIVLASTAIPIVFSPGRFPYDGSNQWIDGGINQVTPIEDALEVAESHRVPLSEVIVITTAPLETEPTSREFKGLVDIGVRVEHILSTQIERQGFGIFQLRDALFQIRESFETLPSRKRAALEEIFKNALGDHYAFLMRRRSIRIRVIHPDPAMWRPFREGIKDRYPIGETVDFWKEFPQTLDRSEKRLHLAYEFGRFMARSLFAGQEPGGSATGKPAER
ncbi:MAG: patatin-like phospholipase family protein [Deltaproteobacteria bacterium]|nr:patatin-like phospholipase family protein [Deltaproteobacteria bacterium]MBW2123504.1 patatin-like phospholipase family protein [Deltaproteobacteria bacterium]